MHTDKCVSKISLSQMSRFLVLNTQHYLSIILDHSNLPIVVSASLVSLPHVFIPSSLASLDQILWHVPKWISEVMQNIFTRLPIYQEFGQFYLELCHKPVYLSPWYLSLIQYCIKDKQVCFPYTFPPHSKLFGIFTLYSCISTYIIIIYYLYSILPTIHNNMTNIVWLAIRDLI